MQLINKLHSDLNNQLGEEIIYLLVYLGFMISIITVRL